MQVKSLSVASWIGAGSLLACLFTGCNGDDDLVPAPSSPSAGAGGESHGAGSAECEAIGHLCHDADTGSGPASECHDTGHQGDADACASAFESCIDTCVPAVDGQQGPYCRALGSYCHAADTGAGRGRECHEIGHAGDEEACIEEFAGCITFCKEALENAGEGGAGGGHGHAGGEAGAHEHAGGHAGAHEHEAGGHAGAHEHGGVAGAHEHGGAAGAHEQAAGQGGG